MRYFNFFIDIILQVGLTNLDVSKNTILTEFFCYENQLTSLDMSKNPALLFLNCGDNQLTSLALNAFFKTLHGNEWKKDMYIYINGNPGAKDCDKSIAEAKGWTVVVEEW